MTAPHPRHVLPRWLTWLLVVSVTVNVALAAGFVAVGIASISNSNSIRANEIRQCQLANTGRRQDIAIWNRLLAIPPAQAAKETAAQRQEVADLERLVAVKDTPRDCQAAYGK